MFKKTSFQSFVITFGTILDIHRIHGEVHEDVVLGIHEGLGDIFYFRFFLINKTFLFTQFF